MESYAQYFNKDRFLVFLIITKAYFLTDVNILTNLQVRKRTELENGESANEESIDSLDKQLAESKFTLAASESKFDDISRKLATLEADATRGNERAEVFLL